MYTYIVYIIIYNYIYMYKNTDNIHTHVHTALHDVSHCRKKKSWSHRGSRPSAIARVQAREKNGGTRYDSSGRQYLVGGIPTPLKNMKVSWDDDIPNIWKNKIHVPNHQPGMWLHFLESMMYSRQDRVWCRQEFDLLTGWCLVLQWITW